MEFFQKRICLGHVLLPLPHTPKCTEIDKNYCFIPNCFATCHIKLDFFWMVAQLRCLFLQSL